jgi:hypothetical protein
VRAYKNDSTQDEDASSSHAVVNARVKGNKFRFDDLADCTFLVRVFQNKNKIKDYLGIVIKRGK